MIKVFLGGTCNESTWRDELIKKLEIDYFNPIVDDWTPDCTEEEIKQRELCSYCLYVITPKMTGVYSIAEVVDDSNKRPEKTIFCLLKKDDNQSFSKTQYKSLMATAKMIKNNGSKYFNSFEEVSEFLNSKGGE